MVLSYVEFACQGGSGVALKVFYIKGGVKMKNTNFANKFQEAYWKAFELSGDPRYMQLFMEEERIRQKERTNLMEQELGR